MPFLFALAQAAPFAFIPEWIPEWATTLFG